MGTSPRIVHGRTEIYIPSVVGEMIYFLPSVGPQIYQTLGKQILANGLSVPTGDETAPLIHQAYYGLLKKRNRISKYLGYSKS
ncbi:hypothetical protein EXS72_01620 [Candidatus Pacearchaeota archaeon]|nr:hypothetical protein [Candidatus Pacearchaeota archaeon]